MPKLPLFGITCIEGAVGLAGLQATTYAAGLLIDVRRHKCGLMVGGLTGLAGSPPPPWLLLGIGSCATDPAPPILDNNNEIRKFQWPSRPHPIPNI